MLNKKLSLIILCVLQMKLKKKLNRYEVRLCFDNASLKLKRFTTRTSQATFSTLSVPLNKTYCTKSQI